MIHIIRTPATKQELADMLETLETYIKLAPWTSIVRSSPVAALFTLIARPYCSTMAVRRSRSGVPTGFRGPNRLHTKP